MRGSLIKCNAVRFAHISSKRIMENETEVRHKKGARRSSVVDSVDADDRGGEYYPVRLEGVQSLTQHSTAQHSTAQHSLRTAQRILDMLS